MPTNHSISLHSKRLKSASTRFPKSWWAAPTEIPLTWISTICIRLKLRPAKPKATTLSASWTAARMRLSTTAFPPSATLCQARAAVLNSYSSRDDEYKGDFARTYFYMVTCYQNLTWKYLHGQQQFLPHSQQLVSGTSDEMAPRGTL